MDISSFTAGTGDDAGAQDAVIPSWAFSPFSTDINGISGTAKKVSAPASAAAVAADAPAPPTSTPSPHKKKSSPPQSSSRLSYVGFIKRLKDPRAQGLVSFIREFIQSFTTGTHAGLKKARARERRAAREAAAAKAAATANVDVGDFGSGENKSNGKGSCNGDGDDCCDFDPFGFNASPHEVDYCELAARSADSQIVREFIARTEGYLRRHPLWASCSDEEWTATQEGLEKYVLSKLYKSVFGPAAAMSQVAGDGPADEKLSRRIRLLSSFVTFQHLNEIGADMDSSASTNSSAPASSGATCALGGCGGGGGGNSHDNNEDGSGGGDLTTQYEAAWRTAGAELSRMDDYKAPADKLVCIINCCRVVNGLLAARAGNNNVGADEFLPALIQVVLSTNPVRLHSNLAFIARFRHERLLIMQARYFFTSLTSACNFLRGVSEASLSMSPAAFRAGLERGVASAEKEKRRENNEGEGEGEGELELLWADANEMLTTPLSPLHGGVGRTGKKRESVGGAEATPATAAAEAGAAKGAGGNNASVGLLGNGLDGLFDAAPMPPPGIRDEDKNSSSNYNRNSHDSGDSALTRKSPIPLGDAAAMAAWEADRYRFRHMSVNDIRVQEVPNLLAEYQTLVQACNWLMANRPQL